MMKTLNKAPHRFTNLNEYGIIFLFALLHAGVSFIARLVGFYELIILTMLTIYMSLVLSIYMKMNARFVLITVVMISFVGMWIGEPIGVIARKYIFPPTPLRHYIVGSICNFVTTWILGFIQVGLSLLFKKSRLYKPWDTKGFIWAIIAIIIVLLVRLSMIDPLYYHNNVALNIVVTCASSMVVILIMTWELMISMQNEMAEKRKHNEAKYSYERLKRQINPHFLFNCMNSLVGIVESNNNEKAIQFIHKLSNIYRYLTDNEQESIVPLNEEIKLVEQYTDLMKMRFPEGLEVHIDLIPGKRYIIPYSLQLLVENAIKHNVISSEEPLMVHISINDDYIQVRNNRNIKQTSIPSSGNGQRYIRKRYMDETGKDIIITENSEEYTVKLPLI